MYSPTNKRAAIDRLFTTTVGGVNTFITFGRLPSEQQECVDIVKSNRDKLYAVKRRDMFLRELISTIMDDEDDDGINETTFSKYEFYMFYIHELIYYPEKFDFLLRAIEERVCVVKATHRFKTLISKILDTGAPRQIPRDIICYDDLIKNDEEARIDQFILKKNWTTKVPKLDELVCKSRSDEE